MVGSLATALLQIYRWVYKWKNFENPLRFDKVTAMSLVVQFFWNTVHGVPAKEMTKDRAKFGWTPMSDVVAVRKLRREIG